MERNGGSGRRKRWLRWRIGLLAAGLLLPFGVPVFAEGPTDSLRTTSQRVLQVLHDEDLQKPERAQERRQQLVSVIGERLSYEEMSKRSLGDQWARMTTAQRQEFIDLFQMVLAKKYVSKIEGFGGQPIQYLSERLSQGCAEVRAKIISAKNEFQLDFRLVERAGKWLIYDVVADGVSLISSYRGQFSRLMQSAAYDGVLERLRENADLPMQARAD
jgi:phospholipid transport system substrate-binding protein